MSETATGTESTSSQTEIEITSDMVGAGLYALASQDWGDSDEDIVKRIYRKMKECRRRQPLLYPDAGPSNFLSAT